MDEKQVKKVSLPESVPYKVLAPYPYQVHVLFDEDVWKLYADAFDIKDRTYLGDGNSACVESFDSWCLVKFEDMTDWTPAQRISVAVHEATHVMQNTFEFVSEVRPGHENQAYMMQDIMTWLLEEIEKCYPCTLGSLPSDSSSQLSLDLEPTSGTSEPTSTD